MASSGSAEGIGWLETSDYKRSTINSMSEALPHTAQIIYISVKLTGSQFTHHSCLDFLQAPMPNLSGIDLRIVPGGPPHPDLIFEYSPDRFPALTKLKLDGIGLKCTSLGSLRELKLCNFPEQPATISSDSLLNLLDGNSRLTSLTLNDYLSATFNDPPPRESRITLRALQTLDVRDTPQHTARLLHHLDHLPPDTKVSGLYDNTRFHRQPSNFNAFLAMLPQERPELYYPLLTAATTARLELYVDAVKCSMRQGGVDLTLSVYSTLHSHAETEPAAFKASYSAALNAAGAILKLAPALTALECDDMFGDVDYRFLTDVLRGTEGLRQLTIIDQVQDHMANALLEAIASGTPLEETAPRKRWGSRAAKLQAVCPHLETLTLQRRGYASALHRVIKALLKTMESRKRMGASALKRLDIVTWQTHDREYSRYEPSYGFYDRGAGLGYMDREDWKVALQEYADVVHIDGNLY